MLERSGSPAQSDLSFFLTWTKARYGYEARSRRAPVPLKVFVSPIKSVFFFADFPKSSKPQAKSGRPDDGTDTTGFFNTEYFVDLKPKEQWRPAFHEDKEAVIAAMDKEVEKIPGAIWNFSQPISDNMEEAVSGVKGEFATKIFGDDLKVLEEKSDEIVAVMRKVPGITDLGVFRVLGQPNLNVVVDRQAAARYQVNVADVQDAIQTAVGGNALTQVLKDEARYDLVLRYLPELPEHQRSH